MISPSTCTTLKQRSDGIKTQWEQAVSNGDVYRADQLRVDYTNVAVSWTQCLWSANRFLFSWGS